MRIAATVFAIAAVIALSIAGSLPAIAHEHCEEPGHSDHDSCPVCQFSIQGFAATVPDPGGLAALFFVLFCLVAIDNLFIGSPLHFARSRAPPVPS
jgi:hypothetical protein